MNDTKKYYEIAFSKVAIGALFRQEEKIYRKTTDHFAAEQREEAGDAPLAVRFYPEERVTLWSDN